MLCCFCVPHKSVGFVERFGEFKETVGPGFHFKVPIMETYAGKLDLRLHFAETIIECKTRDNTFVCLTVHIHYSVQSATAAPSSTLIYRPDAPPVCASEASTSSERLAFPRHPCVPPSPSETEMQLQPQSAEKFAAQSAPLSPLLAYDQNPSAEQPLTPDPSRAYAYEGAARDDPEVKGKQSLRPKLSPAAEELACSSSITPAMRTELEAPLLRPMFAKNAGAYRAFYCTEDAPKQLVAVVQDAMRSRIPRLSFEDLFTAEGWLEEDVCREANAAMQEFGYEVRQVMVVHIALPPGLRDAIHAIKAARVALQVAAIEGQTKKEVAIIQALARRDALRLAGEGIAKMRHALLSAMHDGVALLEEPGYDPRTVLHELQCVLHLQLLRDQAAASGHAVLYVPAHPGAVQDARAGFHAPSSLVMQ